MEDGESLLSYVLSTLDDLLDEVHATIWFEQAEHRRHVRIMPKARDGALTVELFVWPTGIDLIARDGDLSYGAFEFGPDTADELVQLLQEIIDGRLRGTYRQLGRKRWAQSLETAKHVYSAQGPVIALLGRRCSKEYYSYRSCAGNERHTGSSE